MTKTREKDSRMNGTGELMTANEDEPETNRSNNSSGSTITTSSQRASSSGRKANLFGSEFEATGNAKSKIPHRTPLFVNKLTGVLVLTILVALLAVIFNDSIRSKYISEKDPDIRAPQKRIYTHDNAEKISKPVTEPPLVKPPPNEKSSSPTTNNLKQDQETIGANLDFISPLKSEIVEDHGTKRTNIAQIDEFNNIRLLPRLKSIVGQDYFRYVKLNLNRQCRLWADDHKCALRDCSVKVCDESAIPAALRDDDSLQQRQAIDNLRTGGSGGRPGDLKPNKKDQECVDPVENEAAESQVKNLSAINKTVASEQIDAMNALFECLEHDHDDGQYIDLLLNPERYTGYSGESAHRIWRAIYQENCFLRPQTRRAQQKNPFALNDMCYEERVFYRAISGLHTSINIHLCANYPLVDGSFSYNLDEFVKRFKGKESYIKNLYFLYLFELKALAKADNYLLSKVNWMPNSGDMTETRDAMKDLLKAIKRFDFGIDETALFKDKAGEKLAQEFSMHFHNITTNIMDCVACSKCRLWGKVQIHGLGTAFKILLTDPDRLTLNRHEINSLINALTRLSSSIEHLEKFQNLIIGKSTLAGQPAKPMPIAKGKKPRAQHPPEFGFMKNL